MRGGSTARRGAPHRVFLLSPASAGGVRMALVLSPRARFELAHRVQREGAPLGEVFRFTSGLYFRGKLAYAEAFARTAVAPGALVIAPGAGLVPASTIVGPAELRAYAAVPVDAEEPRFVEPLVRDARALAARLASAGEDWDVVLLGSVASPKYVGPLLGVLGRRLLFPPDFVGRGDMSRGGLLLRAVRSGVELPYAPVDGAIVKGKRPPRLEPIRWARKGPPSRGRGGSDPE